MPDSAITKAGAVRRDDGGHQVLGVGVLDRVHGVEPQAVDVEVAHPLLGRLQRPLADGVRVLVVVVDRLAPRRLVVRGEVGAERLQRLGAGGADVVVDDVEQHREALGVGGVDQALQPLRAAVGGLRGRQVDAVVAPAVAAGELGHRHQLDRRHPELAQAAQMRDGGVERPRGSEGADVQLVDHQVVDAGRRPALVGPLEGGGVEQPRRPAQALRLPAAAGVGQLGAVDQVRVVRARLHRRLVHAVAGVLERVLAPVHPQADPLGVRRPDAELGAAVAEGEGAEAAFE